jgi:hypothetical protein
MKKILKLTLAVIICQLSLPSAYCQKVIKGEPKSLGDGSVYTWIRLDKDGNTEAIGVNFSEQSLSGLPKPTDPGGMKILGDFITFEYNIDFPKEISSTPFNHLGLNWNPGGHIPPEFYGVPHFDFHFYTMNMSDRHMIKAVGEDTNVCYKPPAPEFTPKDYICAPVSAEPMMGSHWVDLSSPEFNGQKFTKTFIYGTYNGDLIFWEPMLTKAFLETKPNVTEKIKLSEKYSKSGLYYPTTYTVKYDDQIKEYSISLDGFVLR